jgi:Asp-tRNA(Asn)/Glu-tRNA(Gln) amidotransferase A subunit family amidase
LHHLEVKAEIIMNLSEMAAGDVILKMREGTCTSAELVTSCLERIKSREEVVGAWAFLDEDASLNQSKKADQRAKEGGASTLSLNGVPVGIKDIFDTSDMSTENGTVACQGRQPTEDAAVLKRLRNAGAVIMGKTVTAELAVYTPGKTTNPHDPSRTPGGSSSGSAAAVAAGMIPMAIGTQTNGSVIRPASYCGVVGYKPTFGTIPRTGVLRQAPSLDQVGVFARNVGDSALLASVLMGREEQYSDTLPWPKLDFARLMLNYDSAPRLAFVKTPVWPESSSSAREAFLTYLHNFDTDIVEIDLPEICNEAVSCHCTIMLCEMAHNYNHFLSANRDQISDKLIGMLEEGKRISVSKYLIAKNLSIDITSAVDYLLKDFSAVLTPSTPSEAPKGLEATGSPIFSTIWSLSGVPAVSLPVLKGASGMPLGLQLVSARGRDTELLRVAQWLETKNKSTIGRQYED